MKPIESYLIDPEAYFGAGHRQASKLKTRFKG